MMALTADALRGKKLAASTVLLLCPHVLFSSACERLTSLGDMTQSTQKQREFVKELVRIFYVTCGSFAE